MNHLRQTSSARDTLPNSQTRTSFRKFAKIQRGPRKGTRNSVDSEVQQEGSVFLCIKLLASSRYPSASISASEELYRLTLARYELDNWNDQNKLLTVFTKILFPFVQIIILGYLVILSLIIATQKLWSCIFSGREVKPPIGSTLIYYILQQQTIQSRT